MPVRGVIEPAPRRLRARRSRRPTASTAHALRNAGQTARRGKGHMRKFATRTLAWAALYGGIFALTTVMAADPATGHFSMGDSRLDVRHAMAVVHDPSGNAEQRQTLVYLTAQPLDAAQVAAAFDADDGVRAQEPAGGYIRLCLDWTGEDC